MVADLILGYIRDHPGLPRAEVIERLADPATIVEVEETLDLLCEKRLIRSDATGGYHARQSDDLGAPERD